MSIREVEVRPLHGLGDYEESVLLQPGVARLRRAAAAAAPRLVGRRLWMVNSTASGGGVVEMLPTMITLLRELGVDARWAVIGTHRSEFFELTKRIHNLIHGVGEPHLSAADRELYEAVARDNALAFRQLLSPDDLVVIHDPQPMAMAPMLAEAMPLALQPADPRPGAGDHGAAGLDPDRLAPEPAAGRGHGLGAGAALVLGTHQPLVGGRRDRRLAGDGTRAASYRRRGVAEAAAHVGGLHRRGAGGDLADARHRAEAARRVYRRVRPPGLWRRTAVRVGENAAAPVRRFRRGAYLLLATALTVYLPLIGTVKVMLPAPDAAAWPGWLLLAVGAGSSALWWRKFRIRQSEREVRP